jgi:hypothetical protein
MGEKAFAIRSDRHQGDSVSGTSQPPSLNFGQVERTAQRQAADGTEIDGRSIRRQADHFSFPPRRCVPACHVVVEFDPASAGSLSVCQADGGWQ